MAAFTPEQRDLLQAAFDHVWARMAALHDDLNEDSTKIASLATILARHGLLTSEEFETTEEELTTRRGNPDGTDAPRPGLDDRRGDHPADPRRGQGRVPAATGARGRGGRRMTRRRAR